MRRKLRWAGWVGLCIVGIGIPRSTNAQDAELQRRLLDRFLDLATRELDLSREQRTGLEGVLEETMVRRRALRSAERRLRGAIADALSDPETGDDAFARLADRLASTKADEVELLRWQRGRLAEVLAPRQTLRFLLIQERLARRIEQERMRRGPER